MVFFGCWLCKIFCCKSFDNSLQFLLIPPEVLLLLLTVVGKEDAVSNLTNQFQEEPCQDPR